MTPDQSQAFVFNHEKACGICVQWNERETGFGEWTIAIDKETGEVRYDPEGMSPEWVGHMLVRLFGTVVKDIHDRRPSDGDYRSSRRGTSGGAEEGEKGEKGGRFMTPYNGGALAGLDAWITRDDSLDEHVHGERYTCLDCPFTGSAIETYDHHRTGGHHRIVVRHTTYQQVFSCCPTKERA